MTRNLTLALGIALAVAGRAPGQAATLELPRMAPASHVSFKPPVSRGAAPDPLVGDYIPAARLGPISEVRFGPTSSGDFNNTPEERYNWGLRDRYERPTYSDPFDQEPRMRAMPASRQNQSRFGERIGDIFDDGGNNGGGGGNGNGNGGGFWQFESDHCFDEMISPITNPFLSEDPRTLTEIRPIFMYQTIPNNNPLYRGGNVNFIGIQGRLALTQRFSIVLNKLGLIAINPGSGSPVGSSSGLAEIWLGPKYNWYRDDQTGTLSSFGMIFQIPTGPGSVYQDTGTLSLTPWINVAQRFGKTSWGTFNFMDTAGYAFSTNSERSEYFYNSAHIDFDVANWNRIFPLLELNWFHYTSNGTANPLLGFEGQDLANIGAARKGSNFLSVAIGARYKFSEPVQMGVACEFPLLNSYNLQKFRLGIDVIWRY